jgi:hypothetical protein
MLEDRGARRANTVGPQVNKLKHPWQAQTDKKQYKYGSNADHILQNMGRLMGQNT